MGNDWLIVGRVVTRQRAAHDGELGFEFENAGAEAVVLLQRLMEETDGGPVIQRNAVVAHGANRAMVRDGRSVDAPRPPLSNAPCMRRNEA